MVITGNSFTNTARKAQVWLSNWRHLALTGIAFLSVGLNLWQLGQNGFGNLYYAAAVRSMSDNWKAFFFASLDSHGFVTVDKPPTGFWLQAASVKIFGYTAFAVLLPQAIAGIGAVLLLYMLVQRTFGSTAGLLASFALAVSPISVVTNRNNTIDSTLIFVMLLAAWAILKATETQHFRWLLLCAVFIGLGFNIKMLEAYLEVPAFAVVYLLGSREAYLKKILKLLAAGAVMAALSLVWVAIVELIPSGLRPYVGSTSNNSEWSLAFGYNGLQRLFGNTNINDGVFSSLTSKAEAYGTRLASAAQTAFAPGGQGGVGLFNTGLPGLLRLFTLPLADQIVWLLPFACVGLLAFFMLRKFQPAEDREQQSMLLWGIWFVTMFGFFSIASFFHQYYLSQFTPAISAIFGITAPIMWREYQNGGWRAWFLPIALAATGAEQIYIIASEPSLGVWMIPIVAVVCLGTAVLLSVFLAVRKSNLKHSALKLLVVAGLGSLLLAPIVWSVIPVAEALTFNLPVAGPANSGFGNGNSAQGVGSNTSVQSNNSSLYTYLVQHQGGAQYIVAVADANTAAPFIIATNKAVMALGGFSGQDPILTTAKFEELVKQGVVSYVYLGGGGSGNPCGNAGGSSSTANNSSTQNSETGPFSGPSGENIGNPPAGGAFPGNPPSSFPGGISGQNGSQNSAILQWVTTNCTTVNGYSQLYYCSAD